MDRRKVKTLSSLIIAAMLLFPMTARSEPVDHVQSCHNFADITRSIAQERDAGRTGAPIDGGHRAQVKDHRGDVGGWEPVEVLDGHEEDRSPVALHAGAEEACKGPVGIVGESAPGDVRRRDPANRAKFGGLAAPEVGSVARRRRAPTD